ncbi:hypothetical protein [Flavobacterium aquiphilum]|uniref:hypothetical protein n=1 Tax=Flavobacterium aquiphilum TaxID=3003261 RepID=UPI0024800759|nr:hypothetical protein [Flavobacterium aquiphilum]
MPQPLTEAKNYQISVLLFSDKKMVPVFFILEVKQEPKNGQFQPSNKQPKTFSLMESKPLWLMETGLSCGVC